MLILQIESLRSDHCVTDIEFRLQHELEIRLRLISKLTVIARCKQRRVMIPVVAFLYWAMEPPSCYVLRVTKHH